MKKSNTVPYVWRSAGLTCALMLAMGGHAWAAPTVKIVPRPLTPREVSSCPSGTRTASGLANTGVGQPLYLEVLVTKGTVVNSVTWGLIKKPSTSLATLQTSPVTNSLPPSDYGDQKSFDVASRQMLVPDVVSESVDDVNDIWNDYVVSVALNAKVNATSNTTVTVTNVFSCANYVGVSICSLCHGDKMADFNATKHATAFTRKINGEAGAGFAESKCTSCHVLGYDKTASATNAGFDDIQAQVGWVFPTNLANLAQATNNWTAMPLALQNKANVQCENCHGPAGRHIVSVFATGVVPNYTNSIGISLSAGSCGQCHDAPTHHMKNSEWLQSYHATGEVFRVTGSCMPCHSTKGFIAYHDADYNPTNALPRSTGNEGITCVACHDPHGPGIGANQLRSFTSITLSNGVVNTSGGAGLLCMQCHIDRYAAESTVLANSRTTPHHGTQGDMLIGANAIEYGMLMPRSRHLNVVQDSCVECHMQTNSASYVGGHTFRLQGSDGTNTVDLTTTCAKCHGAITNFNFGGEDWNRNGVIEGVQSEIQGLMNSIAMLLPPYGTTNKPSPQSSWTLSQRRAAWNYLYVWEDRSLGVHNPKYAAAILQASLDDLRGGIDVNRDGLPDTWQNQYYGSFTNSSAAPGADPLSKGLTNLQNYQLGLNPTKLDTDGDGYSDAVELQSGSDPLNSGSTPTKNMVTIQPALELAYLPGTNGISMHFQAIDTLAGGTWTNVGPGFISTTNTWYYQLISPRGSKQQSFRVSTP